MAFDVFWFAPLALLGGVFAVAPTNGGVPTEKEIGESWWQSQPRIVVRITPFSGRSRDPAERTPTRLKALKGKSEECLPLAEVSGVRLGQDSLLLFMRDRRIFSANFERACTVESFYSGFYVERPDDGRICAGRDQLHARSGADCTLGSFNEMTPVD